VTYTPKPGNAVNFDFTGAGYSAPAANAVNFNFADVLASAAITIAPITLSATGTVSVSAAADLTIGNLIPSISGGIIGDVSLNATIAPITVSATAKAIVSATLAATLGEITVVGTGTVIDRRSDPGVPWWWAQYVVRIAQERAATAAKRPEPVEGDGWAIMPMPFGHGVGFHDPDADIAEFLVAMFPAWRAAA
jgi:hypothetical protein